jgi:uncharacterized protein YjiS (DUF1127 family)
MATLAFPSRAQHNTSFFESLRSTLTTFARGVQDGLDMADRYHALSRMSDDQLARRGLTRADITRAALLGSERV